MNKIWLHIFMLLLIQSTFEVVNAKVDRGSFLSRCCVVEKTRATYRHEHSMKKLLRECDEEQNNMDESNVHDKALTITACLAQCIANKLKLLNDNNTLNEIAYRDYIEHEVATHDYQKAVARDVAETCIKKVQNDSDVNSNGCSAIPVQLIGCVTREFFHACPVELQDQSEHCVNMRSWVSRD